MTTGSPYPCETCLYGDNAACDLPCSRCLHNRIHPWPGAKNLYTPASGPVIDDSLDAKGYIAVCGQGEEHGTPWDRLCAKLWPAYHLTSPEVTGTNDLLVTQTTVVFSWPDRLRLLLSGRCLVVTKTRTEHVIGKTHTTSVAYPLPPK